jgi:hypothetical protein
MAGMYFLRPASQASSQLGKHESPPSASSLSETALLSAEPDGDMVVKCDEKQDCGRSEITAATAPQQPSPLLTKRGMESLPSGFAWPSAIERTLIERRGQRRQSSAQ